MKNFLLLFFIIVFLAGCTNETMRQSGNVTIMTPAAISPSMKSIIGDTGAQINPSSLDQSRFRYDIIIESDSRRLYFGQLKKNEKLSISVPGGIPLNIKVGVFYAISSTSMIETYNSYLAAGGVEKVYVMPGESKYLTIKLDLVNSVRVNAYYNSNFGIAAVSGGVIGAANPYFSLFPLTSGVNELYMQYAGGTFSPVGISGLIISGKGIISRVTRDPGGVTPYWYVQNSGVLRSTDGSAFTALTGTPPVFTGLGTYLSRVFSVKSVFVNDSLIPQERYFFFLNYGLGYIVFDNIGGTWSSASNLDFSEYDSLYQYEPFLLDVEQDVLINGSLFRKISYAGNLQWLFFATKIGLFYVNEQALVDFAQGDKDAGINKFKKIINIPNPFNPKENILVTKVKVIGNTVYLGSKRGVYTIDKGSSEWNKFVYDSVDDFTYYDLSSIKKVEEFTYEEPVVSMDLTNNVLCIATPKRVWFKNMNNGKTDMVTVWDGLPFVPAAKLVNAKKLNEVDFKTHDVASINFTLWNAGNSRFWIGTDYGLCSVDINRLNLQ